MNKQEKMNYHMERIKNLSENYSNRLSDEVKKDLTKISSEISKGNDNGLYRKNSLTVKGKYPLIHYFPGCADCKKGSVTSSEAIFEDVYPVSYQNLINLMERGDVLYVTKGKQRIKASLENVIQKGREMLNDKTIKYGNKTMPKVPVLSEVFAGFPKSFKENHKGYEVMAECPYGLGNLLTSRINCTNIGAVTGAVSPLIGWYALLSDFGKMPIMGVVMAPVAYLMSFPLSFPLSMGGLVGGLLYGHQLDNYLKSKFCKKEDRE